MLGAVLGSLFASQQPQDNSGETTNTGGLLSSILGSILSQGSEKTDGTPIGANILSHIISGAISNGQNPYDTTPVESPDGQPVTPIAPTTIGPTSTFRTGYEDILNDWAERFKKSEKQNETKIETEPEKKREKRSRTLKDRRGDRRRAKAKESRDRDKRDKKERSDRMKRNRDNAVRKERNKRRRSGSKSGGVL